MRPAATVLVLLTAVFATGCMRYGKGAAYGRSMYGTAGYDSVYGSAYGSAVGSTTVTQTTTFVGAPGTTMTYGTYAPYGGYGYAPYGGSYGAYGDGSGTTYVTPPASAPSGAIYSGYDTSGYGYGVTSAYGAPAGYGAGVTGGVVVAPP